MLYHKPVSYTHLDVYKRQVKRHVRSMQTILIKNCVSWTNVPAVYSLSLIHIFNGGVHRNGGVCIQKEAAYHTGIGSRGIGGVSRNCIWLNGIYQDWNGPSV